MKTFWLALAMLVAGCAPFPRDAAGTTAVHYLIADGCVHVYNDRCPSSYSLGTGPSTGASPPPQ